MVVVVMMIPLIMKVELRESGTRLLHVDTPSDIDIVFICALIQIQIEAVFLIDFTGDIAIDDLDIEMVPCSQLTTAAPIPSTTPTPGIVFVHQSIMI